MGYSWAQLHDDAYSRRSALRAMGEAAFRRGDIGASERYLHEALTLVPDCDKRWIAALTLRITRAVLALDRTSECTQLVIEVVDGGLVAADAREANEAANEGMPGTRVVTVLKNWIETASSER